MKSILIADTTKEEREQIVVEATGNIDGCAFFLTEKHFSFCDFCDMIFGKATSVLFQSKSNNEEKFQ